MLRLDLRGEGTGAHLCRARFVGPEPDAYAADGRVVFDYGHFGFGHWMEDLLLARGRAAQIAINDGIPWTVDVRGGMSQVEIDLSATRVESIDVHGGMSQVALTLGRPKGEAPIRIRGGASKLTIRRPEGMATRVRIAGAPARWCWTASAMARWAALRSCRRPASMRPEIAMTSKSMAVRAS